MSFAHRGWKELPYSERLRHAVLLTGFLLYIFGREFRCMRRHETSVLFACFGNIYDTMNYEAGEGRVSVSIYMDW